MTATSDAREALAKLSPQARETNRVLVIVADLLVEQNEHLAALVAATQRNTISNFRNAGTPRGAGVPAVPAPADQPAPGGAQGDEQDGDGNVRLLEPDVPPVDDADQGDAGGRPAPAKKATAKKAAAAKKTTAAAKADTGKG